MQRVMMAIVNDPEENGSVRAAAFRAYLDGEARIAIMRGRPGTIHAKAELPKLRSRRPQLMLPDLDSVPSTQPVVSEELKTGAISASH